MKNILLTGLLFLVVISLNAQETEKKSKKELKAEKKAKQIEEIQSIVDDKTFVFKATNANPMKGRTINLTTQYDVKITQDSIFSYLPYYGVAYNVNYGSTDSPMIFEKPFETCDMEKTKNGYLVKVTAKNGNDRLEYSFHISETGTTTLNVSSMNRQSISYYGNLEKIQVKEENK
jgi:hypothetical protein